MKTFKLPISPDYVQDWGVWEAVRELLQNALDQEENTSELMKFEKSQDGESNTLTIATTEGKLEVRTLVLGISEKTSDSRGKFGEGYKLAMLVLLRRGHDVTIFNGEDVWRPKIIADDDFGTDILAVDIYEGENPDGKGVKWIVSGITEQSYKLISENFNPELGILKDPKQKGRVYVGGLFVSKIENLHYGYGFTPKQLRLDRDRSLVSNYDVTYQSSKLWEGKEGCYELVKLRAIDVEYIKHFMPASAATGYYVAYQKEYGNVIPVSTQEEINKCIEGGVKFAMVPQLLKDILYTVRTWKIPNRASPAVRLERLLKQHYFTEPVKKELTEILEMLK